jgi:ribonuclease HII
VHRWIVGVDEVGRGPLAGPVTVCAFAVRADEAAAVDGALCSAGCGDSKELTPAARERVAQAARRAVLRGAARVGIRSVSAEAIDRDGITAAVARALSRALLALDLHPEEVEVRLDGSLKAPRRYANQRTIIRGDGSDTWIGAASCVAKVYRDRLMERLAALHPGYGFEDHAGYGTLAHRRAIHRLGLCPLHRRSFCHSFGPKLGETQAQAGERVARAAAAADEGGQLV